MGNVMFMRKGAVHTVPVGAPLISSLNVGAIVKINEGGVPAEYLVVNHGIPDGAALYDESCDGTWLLRKEVLKSAAWDGTDNDYANSDAHSYLSGDFLNLFDEHVLNTIKEVKLPYHKGTGSAGSVASGAEGLPVKAFLLGGYEVGFTTATHLNFPVDGAALAYFKDAENTNRIAYISGTAIKWGTRSANTHNTNGIWAVNASGAYISDYPTANIGIRPAFVLPSDTPMVENDDGSMEVMRPALPSGYTRLVSIKSSGEQYIDTGFKPDNNTKVVIDLKPDSSIKIDDVMAFYGARRNSNNMFAAGKLSGLDWLLHAYFCNSSNTGASTTEAEVKQRRIIVQDGSVFKTGKYKTDCIAGTFASEYNMYLFCCNDTNKAERYTPMELYSCKIYNNGTIVRDFVPCKSGSGELGLYDCVEGKFYGNAGTGSFTSSD